MGTSKLTELQQLRQEVKGIKRRHKAASADLDALQQEWERCPKGVDRSAFVELITGMTESMAKQQVQIDRALDEMTDAEKNVTNLVNEASDIFKSVEARVYNAATSSGPNKGNEFCRDAFAKLVALRETYRALIDTVRERGQVKKDMYDIDGRCSKLQRKVSEYPLQSMRDDLSMVTAKNAELKQRLEQTTGNADI